MAWQTIDTLGADVPNGREVYGYDEAGNHVIATMRYMPDGSRFWMVSPRTKDGQMMAPAVLTHWRELDADPA